MACAPRSADLWVAGKVANSVESGTTGHLNYANRVITGEHIVR